MTRVIGADIYRDGGSYGFSFDSADGNWYEFFIQIKDSGTNKTKVYDKPRIYLEGVNSKNLVKSLDWEEAKAFIEPLEFESGRFRELIDIIAHEGRPV